MKNYTTIDLKNKNNIVSNVVVPKERSFSFSSLDSTDVIRRTASNLVKQAYHKMKETNPEEYEALKLKRKKGRYWNRAKTGQTLWQAHKIHGYSFKFLTLTSSPRSRDLSAHWDALRKRLERYWHVKNFAYIKMPEMNEKGDLVHLHIIMYTPYIPVEKLRKMWEQMHKAFEVFIEAIEESELDHNFGYLSNYLTKDMPKRFSYSRSWVGNMAVSKLWRTAVKIFFRLGINDFSWLINTWTEFILAEHVPKYLGSLYDFMVISSW